MPDSVAIVDSPPPAPPPAPTQTIRVSQMPTTATPAAPPEKKSARDSLFKDLRKKANMPEVDEPTPTGVDSTRKTDDKSSVTQVPPEDDSPSSPPPEASDKTPPAAADKKKEKVNPWKLVDEYKAKTKELEGKIVESEKRAVPEAKWKQMEESLKQREQRLNELEEEIRYVNYSKSKEYQEKYEAPYKKAWTRAMSELDGVMVVDGEGERAINADDIREIANLPLAKAKMLAQEKFGDFAPEVLANARDIRKLYDEQATALENAKKAATDREQTQNQQQAEIRGSLVKDWNEFNEKIQSHEKFGTYFKPIDGDTDGNQRLAKGFELADRAFSEHPLTPGLTTEQRKAIIERHAVVRNRAAAFGRLVAQNTAKQARIAELEKELSQYRESDPDASGRTPQVNGENRQGTAMSRLSESLRKIAK